MCESAEIIACAMVPPSGYLARSDGRRRCPSAGSRGGLCPQLLEPCPRALQVFEIENLRGDRSSSFETDEIHEYGLERAALRKGAERVADEEEPMVPVRHLAKRLADRVGTLLEERAGPCEVRVDRLQSAWSAASVVMVYEVVGQYGANSFEVARNQAAAPLEEGRDASSRASRLAFDQLQARRAAGVGIEGDDGDDVAFGVDLGQGEILHLERHPVFGPDPSEALEHEAIAGRGEHGALDSGPGLRDDPLVGQQDVSPAGDEHHSTAIVELEHGCTQCL